MRLIMPLLVLLFKITIQEYFVNYANYQAHPQVASSLAEVLGRFHDPFSGLQLVPGFQFMGLDENRKPIVQCYTKECLDCAKLFLVRLMKTTQDVDFLTEVQDLMLTMGLNQNVGNEECRSIVFENSIPRCEYPLPNPSELRNFLALLEKGEERCPCATLQEHQSWSTRSKRASTSSSVASDVDTHALLFCVDRGSALQEDRYYLRLCASCTGLHYFGKHVTPSFIMTVSCAKNDTLCLSGHCDCEESYVRVHLYDAKTFEKLNRIITVSVACTPYLHPHSALRELFHL